MAHIGSSQSESSIWVHGTMRTKETMKFYCFPTSKMAAFKNLYCSCFGVEYIKKSKMADPNFKMASNPNSKMANDNVIT